MRKTPLKNTAASVRRRLYNLSKAENRPFDELLQYYAIERWLYRLSRSKYKDQVILKGALMFVVWKTSQSRATRDIDLLGRLDNRIDNLVQIAKEVCQIPVEDDGILFDPKTVKGKQIDVEAEYKGIRIKFRGRLEQARIHMQLDFGFGDQIFPMPREIDYPTLLDMPSPHLKGYPPETVIAEKFQAMVDHGIRNTRYKDFYDVWLMSHQFEFEGKSLARSIHQTLNKRKTPMVGSPLALTTQFFKDPLKMAQWKAFIAKSKLAHAPADLSDVVSAITKFLSPIISAGVKKEKFNLYWKASGPWSKRKGN